MKKIACFLFFVCLPIYGQRADFFREDVTFRLDGFFLNVEGYYWFLNHSSKPVHSNIFYPFPNYSGEKIDSIRLYNLSAGRETEFKRESKYGISFDLSIASFDTVLFQVGYRQELKGDSAVYILKTTQGWGQPIDRAEFRLVVPDSLIVKKFSYPPDKSYLIEKKKIYIWKMKDFMPVRDMVYYF